MNESDPRRNVHHLSSSENKAWKKFRPVRDLNPWPLRIPVQCFTNWANKPTGSWSLSWFHITARITFIHVSFSHLCRTRVVRSSLGQSNLWSETHNCPPNSPARWISVYKIHMLAAWENVDPLKVFRSNIHLFHPIFPVRLLFSYESLERRRRNALS